ncbi:MAG: hypothetical protein ACLQVI_26125 [Polyangiaceae bacterium]
MNDLDPEMEQLLAQAERQAAEAKWQGQLVCLWADREMRARRLFGHGLAGDSRRPLRRATRRAPRRARRSVSRTGPVASDGPAPEPPGRGDALGTRGGAAS